MPPEPSAALFFFADVLPFFVRAALGTFFDGAAAARDGAGATPPVAVVIRGGKKRLRARPALGGAPAMATPTLPALGFPAATGGGGVAAVQRGERGAGVRVHGWVAGRRRRRARGVGGGEERVRRERSSVPRAEAGAPNTPREIANPTARPTPYTARAVIARPLEPPAGLRAR